jgi:hypothetical protein
MEKVDIGHVRFVREIRCQGAPREDGLIAFSTELGTKLTGPGRLITNPRFNRESVSCNITPRGRLWYLSHKFAQSYSNLGIREVHRQANSLTMSTTGNIRIIGFIKRRPDLTEEQFYKHWENIHGPLVAPWAVKHGIISYSQVCLVYRNTTRVPDTAPPHYVPHLLFYDQRRLTVGHAGPHE